MDMTYNLSGEHVTQAFESCRLTAYRDIKGVLTIGWGHTGTEVVEGLVWTQEQADAQLVQDMAVAVRDVNRLVTVPVTQNEFDALVDFTFNAGGGAFAGSTLLKLLNTGDYQGAAAQFDLWDHASGQVVAGLLRRRLAEKQEFQS
jgi:lysozyme